MPRITLLTDFGTRDGYVGAMKGVVASIYPGVQLDDVSHDVPRGDPAAAARTLGRYWRLYPPATVHVVVVDPGVGTERRALCLEADRRYVIAPDNGIVSQVIREASSWRAWVLENERYFLPVPSRTFHGRDVFAPVGAHVAQGTHPARLGRPVTDPVLFEEPDPTPTEDGYAGEVVAVDRFGNLVTNLPAKLLEVGADVRVELEGDPVPVATSYGAVPAGARLALANSDGRVEVAVRDGSAREQTGRGAGAQVRIRVRAAPSPGD